MWWQMFWLSPNSISLLPAEFMSLIKQYLHNKMKEVTVTVTLLLEDDQPACDWIYESIAEQLGEDEQILYYNDNEPVVK